MGEHLTPQELLLALKQCKGQIGGSTCQGCPNAVPGTEDKDGLCACRVDTYEEVIRFLEKFLQNG